MRWPSMFTAAITAPTAGRRWTEVLTIRLIDADNQNLQEAIGRMAFQTRQDIYDLIATQPTVDAVPVVYCKDCKYADAKRRNVTEKRYYNFILFCRNADFCGGEPLAMRPDDFCSYGERKDEANES